MSNKHVHIVSFDVPWPDNYGGVIDVFHKVRHLHNAGWKISLHCYEYGRGISKKLNEFTSEVFYYKRNTGKTKLLSSKPYIVVSRDQEALLMRLQADRSPILFEGIHTTLRLPELAQADRKTIVRAHNIEHEYYALLSRAEKNPFRRQYLKAESVKLKRYESVLKEAGSIAAITENDHRYFSEKYHHSFHLPPFHSFDSVTTKTGYGDYYLYHANLSIAENHQAAMWLVTEVLPLLKRPLYIAGQKPRQELIVASRKAPLFKLIESPSSEEMTQLIQDAQVHLLPTFQPTGMKLKLLNALFCGRHVVVNSAMIQGTGLNTICATADEAAAFAQLAEEHFQLEMDTAMIRQREEFLQEYYSNKKGADLLTMMLQTS